MGRCTRGVAWLWFEIFQGEDTDVGHALEIAVVGEERLAAGIEGDRELDGIG